MISAPLASWDSESLADWLELKAVSSSDANSSITDLVREFQRNGTTEEVPGASDDEEASQDDDDPIEDLDARSMMIAEDAFAAIEERRVSCGMDGVYPFDINSDSIQLRQDGLSSAYLFLLLLGEFGQQPGIERATKIFEHMCAWAARAYFGPKTSTAVFGFPRDAANLSRGFVPAVDDLCELLSEGVKCRRTPKASEEKDAGLDIVAWRAFPDERKGKLIAFGQCATGNDWRAKTTELLPEAWCGTWMAETPAASPLLRLFFLPYRVRQKDWESVSRKAGIVFDRCRLAYCIGLDSGDQVLAGKWLAWTKHVYDKLRESVSRKLNVKVA